MGRHCDVCGKRPSTGHAVSHSNIKTLRRWEPNLQRVRQADGRRVLVCTRCIRTARKNA